MAERTPNATLPSRIAVAALIGAGALLALASASGVAPSAIANHSEADWLGRLADRGDDGAQLQLGLAYREGRYGLQADAATGLHWLEAAARQGNGYAADLVGNAYAEGRGAAPDLNRAERWWKRAAERGNANAQRHLGQRLLAAQREQEGLRWLRRAADQGDRPAHAELARLYRRNEVADDDLRRGQETVARLGARLHAPSIETLSALLDTVAQSSTWQQSFGHLRALADHGDPLAEYQLGLHYGDGAWAVTRDPQQSTRWLQRAAAAGNSMALDALDHAGSPPGGHPGAHPGSLTGSPAGSPPAKS
ncbi:tetratricopeptide repeat protein [Endothiovibrio diazotrophicus]